MSTGSASAQIQDPGVTAFQQAGVENSNFFEKRFDFFIPPGKRLVIEKLSAALSMPHKGVFGPPVIQNTQLVTTVNGILVTHEFAKPIFQSSTGVPSQLTDHFLYLLSPNLYADGGPVSLIVTPLSVDLNQVVLSNVVISGHLVCAQGLPCGLGSLTPNADGTPKAEGTPRDLTVMAQTRPRFAKPSQQETVAKLKGK